MRIDYLSRSSLISDQANAVHTVRMSAALAGLGHEVTLHCLEGSGQQDSDIFEYFGAPRNFRLCRYRVADYASLQALVSLRRLGLPTGYVVRLLHGVLSVRRRIAHDSEISNKSHHLYFARNAEWLLGCLDCDSRFIYESHRPPHDWWDKLIQRHLFGRSGFMGLVVISQSLRRMYLSEYPRLPRTKVVVSPDGADEVPEFTLECERNSRLQVGYVGHLYPGRGGELMIAVARAIPDMDFHLVGGREEDIARLRTLSPSENLIIYGHRPPADLNLLYRRFDVVIAPYQKTVAVAGGTGNTVDWMSPLKIFEYMAHGKAIIASDLPVLHEVLMRDRTAIMVDPVDVGAWIEALYRLLGNPEQRRALGRQARRSFVENYTWSKRAQRILDVLRACN